MKKAKKYSTFEELKSSDIKTSVDRVLTLKKHSDYENLMREIMQAKLKNNSHSVIKR